MVNGFIRCSLFVVGMLCATMWLHAEYKVAATPLTQDIKDLSERNSKVVDQNGERCALIKLETVIPNMFTFNLGAQQIEKRVNKDDEIWIWVSADVKKMTIRCADCTALKDYRVSLKPGTVYRAKLTTGMPVETSTTQYLNLYCEQVPYMVSIDGAEPVEQRSRNFNAELPIGAHNIQVSARFFQTYSAEVRLERSRVYVDTVVLEKNYGELAVHANLTNYEVMIDGEVRSFAPIYRVEPGMHYITVTKNKYQTVQDTVVIALGQRTSFPVNFIPAFTIVSITTREPKTEIWVDDSLRGHDKLNLELLYGYHRIEGRREGFDTWEYPVHEFNSQSERSIVIPKLNQQFGSIRLSVFPAEASLHIDGSEVEMRNGIYAVKQATVGMHFVYIRMPDYRSVRDSIFVEPSKLTSEEYHLEYIPLGTITIQTDPGIAIFAVSETDGSYFLGTQAVTGKRPAGENVIMLKNTNGDKCYHHVFVAEGTSNPRTYLPFFRQVVFRSNVPLKTVSLQHEQGVLPVRTNKRLNLPPLQYTMVASKAGYNDYSDTIDMSRSDANDLVYQINMTKLGDSTRIVSQVPTTPFQRYYANAGKWYVGILNFGYTYSFADSAHIVSLGAVAFRYKMLGVSLLNFELPVYGSQRVKMNVFYNPKLSLVVPFSKAGALTFYGGLNMNLTDAYKRSQNETAVKTKVRSYIRGGISLLANKSGKAPFEIFGEYRYPIKNDYTEYKKSQLFRVGISFSFGVDM